MKDESKNIKDELLKAYIFVLHIEAHLERDSDILQRSQVMCKICNRTINDIWELYHNKYNEEGVEGTL